MKFLIFFALVIAGPQSMASLDSSDRSKLDNAIDANDFNKVKEIVGGSKLSDQEFLVRRALTPEHGKRYQCRTEIVKFLIEKNAPATESENSNLMSSSKQKGDLELAVDNMCSEIVEILVSKMESAHIAKGTKTFEVFKHEVWAEQDERNAKRVTSIVKTLMDANKKQCPSKSDSNPNCEALAHLQAEFKRVAERDANAEYAASPDGVRDAACEVQAKIKSHKGYIDRQRKIAKVSGTVDVSIMHNSGERIVELEKEMVELKSQYKKLTKKALSLSVCPK